MTKSGTRRPKLPQAFSASKLCVPPQIELRDGLIAWRWEEYLGSVVGREVEAEGLLDRFCRIRRFEHVLQFARQFGPLGICKHANPICHPSLPGGGLMYDPEQGEASGVLVVSPPTPESFYCSPTQLRDGFLAESTDWWIKLASAMRACVNVATSLQRARRPRVKDLGLIYSVLHHGLEPLPITEQMLPQGELAEEATRDADDGAVLAEVADARVDGFRSQAWIVVLELLNNWLIACPARLYFRFTDSRPVDFSMSFVAGDQRGCFPALVFELIGRIRATKGKWMVNCAHCGMLASPRREPTGNRVFCEVCRAEGWPMRYANRDQYARNSRKILAGRKRRRRAAAFVRRQNGTQTKRG
jgi:hypothetical protein